jgi:gliding motility-associated lipoprotein GldH
MRITVFTFLCAVLLTACNTNRVFERNEDLNDQSWLVGNKPSFDFMITDTAVHYNLYCNIRSEVSYPKANLYFTYYLTDSTGVEVEQKLITEFLFDKKTGKPFGKSALGDIYDHQILLLKNYKFNYPHKYTMAFEQFMRMDTLKGVIAVGLRVEKAEGEE